MRTESETATVSDFMVRNPICAAMWQPISFVRQQMLVNSFSYLPVQRDGKWCLVSDRQVAVFLQSDTNKARQERLAMSLQAACDNELRTNAIALKAAKCILETTHVKAVVPDFDGEPILVVASQNEGELVGILTAFDLL